MCVCAHACVCVCVCVCACVCSCYFAAFVGAVFWRSTIGKRLHFNNIHFNPFSVDDFDLGILLSLENRCKACIPFSFLFFFFLPKRLKSLLKLCKIAESFHSAAAPQRFSRRRFRRGINQS